MQTLIEAPAGQIVEGSLYEQKNPDPIKYEYLPYLEATARIRKVRGKSLFVVVNQWAHLKDDPNADLPRLPQIYAHAKVTRENALRFLASAFYNEQKQNKHLIRIGECSNCLFIGE